MKGYILIGFQAQSYSSNNNNNAPPSFLPSYLDASARPSKRILTRLEKSSNSLFTVICTKAGAQTLTKWYSPLTSRGLDTNHYRSQKTQTTLMFISTGLEMQTYLKTSAKTSYLMMRSTSRLTINPSILKMKMM